MQRFLTRIKAQYKTSIETFGAISHGVLWTNGTEQMRRFKILLDLIAPAQDFSINDLGCGYGALLDYLHEHNLTPTQYYGYDITPEMLTLASSRFSMQNIAFIQSSYPTQQADYTLISGTFNLCDDAPYGQWLEYVFERLLLSFSSSSKAIVFNGLSTSKTPKIDGLFYIDKEDLLNFCYYGLNASEIKSYDDKTLQEWSIAVFK